MALIDQYADALDQVDEVLADIVPRVVAAEAKCMYLFYKAFVDAGFSPEWAHDLVVAHIKSGKELVSL